MAKSEITKARLPRGAKPVSQAFFTALETIPEASRAAVAKAAQTLIRDQMKIQREKATANAAKVKAAPAKEKVGKSLATKPVFTQPAVKANVASKAKTAAAKRRSSKQHVA